MSADAWDWGIFWVLLLACLAFDLALMRKGGSEPSARSSIGWSVFWIGAALGFAAWLSVGHGKDVGLTFLSAYALEKSLSVDNLFIFFLVFRELHIPQALQRRVLMWGIFGTLLARALLLGVGVSLLTRFDWLFYPFAIILALSAARLAWGRETEARLVQESCAVCTTWVARLVPVTSELHGSKFWIVQRGRATATPLMIALILIETSDIVFSFESVPAVLAITTDPYLAYTSNMFAVLGMRALFFVLAQAVAQLRFLRAGLSVVLLFIALKMLLHDVVEISSGLSLTIIGLIILPTLVASKLAGTRARLTD